VVMYLPNGIVGLLTWLRGFRDMHDGSKN